MVLKIVYRCCAAYLKVAMNWLGMEIYGNQYGNGISGNQYRNLTTGKIRMNFILDKLLAVVIRPLFGSLRYKDTKVL